MNANEAAILVIAGYARATADAVAWCLAHDFPAVAEALQRGAHRGVS